VPPQTAGKPVVVDANIVFAAFIRDGATRELILDRGLDLRSPPWLWDEVAARYAWLLQKSGLSPPVLDELLRQVRTRIADVPEELILAHKAEAIKRAGKSGKKDAPYIAAVLAVQGVLWTHDEQLARDGRIETVTTKELLDLD
jgi:predicted nucleic acid-binding protein